MDRSTAALHSPPNAGVLAAPKAEPLLAPKPPPKGELAAGVAAAPPNSPPPVAGADAPKPPNAGVLAGGVEPKPPNGDGLAAPKAGAAAAGRWKMKQHTQAHSRCRPRIVSNAAMQGRGWSTKLNCDLLHARTHTRKHPRLQTHVHAVSHTPQNAHQAHVSTPKKIRPPFPQLT